MSDLDCLKGWIHWKKLEKPPIDEDELDFVKAIEDVISQAGMSASLKAENNKLKASIKEASDLAKRVVVLSETLAERCLRYEAALQKIADPTKRDHKEPDAYTTLGCVMHIANEALELK